MRIIRAINKMQRLAIGIKRDGKSIGFVPTMGALHNGHLSLIRQARKENDFVVVSIFVNPAQFGPNEDFRSYPGMLKADVSVCRKAGVDIIFYPEAGKIYPQGYKTYVFIEKLSGALCGKYRCGHFRGVATIVTKLFNIIQPAVAYFGQKDAQQAIIIKQLVRDLNMPVKIKVMPIIREQDGMALSSRNSYLSAKERGDANVLYAALGKARTMIKQGAVNTASIILAMRKIIQGKKTANIQYIEIVDLNELKPVKKIKGKVLIALAAWIGKTRLIDNIIVKRRYKNSQF
ncbi:MAG: pantoate--beta-alanine ligase [Candidatus Omnitrophota bacterium]